MRMRWGWSKRIRRVFALHLNFDFLARVLPSASFRTVTLKPEGIYERSGVLQMV